MARRDDVLDAALLVLAAGGLKGLTHRAVDAQAGLPSGSTANVFRDRHSLVRGILEELERRDWGLLQAGDGEPPAPGSAEELAQLLANGTARMLDPAHAPLARVRLTMSLAYPDDVRDGHDRLCEALAQLMTAAGLDAPAGRVAQVAALLDGTLLHTLTVSPAPLDPAALAHAIRALLTS